MLDSLDSAVARKVTRLSQTMWFAGSEDKRWDHLAPNQGARNNNVLMNLFSLCVWDKTISCPVNFFVHILNLSREIMLESESFGSIMRKLFVWDDFSLRTHSSSILRLFFRVYRVIQAQQYIVRGTLRIWLYSACLLRSTSCTIQSSNTLLLFVTLNLILWYYLLSLSSFNFLRSHETPIYCVFEQSVSLVAIKKSCMINLPSDAKRISIFELVVTSHKSGTFVPGIQLIQSNWSNNGSNWRLILMFLLECFF